jgi:hypothetical protein
VGSRDDIAQALLLAEPRSRAEVLGRPCPVPDAGGVYGWWFRQVPSAVDASRCAVRDGLTLLYVGISPKEAPARGDQASRSTLRSRITTHYAGNAEGSTLRRTLGCLLENELGIELRRVGSGQRYTFVEGEQRLSAWMADNAFVALVPCERPWEVERELIGSIDLPLNLDENRHHPFHPGLSAIRSAALRRARELPIVPNPGVGGRGMAAPGRLPPFAASLDGAAGPSARLGRLVLDGEAAMADRTSVDSSRDMLLAALTAINAGGLRLGVLVTPAGFVDRKLSGTWPWSQGWGTAPEDFEGLGAEALVAAQELVTPDVLAVAAGSVDHLVLGIDVWPTPHREPHAETAVHVDFSTGTSRLVTGKTYPTTAQQSELVRQPDPATHVTVIGDERVAVLVCHDLAAWSPRGNAVAAGDRANAWRAMQSAVTAGRPTIAVQLPHTVDKAGTWRAAWSRFAALAGPQFVAGTTAIRHLDQGYGRIAMAVGPTLLAGTGAGSRVVDVVVRGRTEGRYAEVARAAPPPRPPSRPVAVRSVGPASAGLTGQELARVALEVFRLRAGAYPDGIRVGELERELRLAGFPVGGNDPSVRLQSALNASQVLGLWRRVGGGPWVPGSGVSKMDGGLSGRALAEALHAFARETYPNRVFHYEEIRVRLERTGVQVKGTGQTTRSALVAARDLFEPEGRRGWWRWK